VSRSHVGVCVRNAGSLRATNCELFFDDIAPDEGDLAKRVLLTSWNFGLNGSGEELVPLVSFHRGLNNSVGDVYLNLDTAGQPIPKTFDTSIAYTITLRATAAECGACTRRFRFWVEDKTLKIERVD
jgi:hypothetical protein